MFYNGNRQVCKRMVNHRYDGRCKDVDAKELKKVLQDVLEEQLEKQLEKQLGKHLEKHLQPIKQDIVGIKQKQDMIFEHVGKLTEYHAETVERLDRIEQKVDKLEKRDHIVDTRLDQHQHMLEILSNRTLSLEAEQARIKKQLVL